MRPLTVACAVFLLVCAGTRVEAQGVATSFDQLSVLVKPGDTISVVDVTGGKTVGRISDLSRDALTLVTRAGPRQLGEANVAQIRQRRGDSLKNGAIIGAVAGTAWAFVGLGVVAMTNEGEMNTVSAATTFLYCTGIGASMGVAIDALIARQRVIYQKPAGGSRVSISPLFRHGRRGAAISVKF